jgi:hypothetical protein
VNGIRQTRFNAVDLTYRAELRQEIAGLRLEFRTELQQVRTELVRWMFGFWVTTLLTMAGLMVALRAR